jgi:hypothetical protein
VLTPAKPPGSACATDTAVRRVVARLYEKANKMSGCSIEVT